MLQVLLRIPMHLKGLQQMMLEGHLTSFKVGEIRAMTLHRTETR